MKLRQCLSLLLVAVTAGCGGSGDSTVYREPAANILPAADFTVAPANGKEPLNGVAFDATRSNDPDGVISSYAWDFGDGGTGTGRTTTHDYTSAGNYTASLVVTDNDGGSSTNVSTATIIVDANQPPVAAIEFTPTAPQPTPSTISFNAGFSDDPDGTIDTYEWDFGDTTTDSGETTSHTFANAGIAPLLYTVTLTVTDDSGFSAQSTVDVTVLPVNKAPTAAFTACPIAACATPDDPPFFAPYTVTFLADTSTDIDGTIVQYEWDFGDGEEDDPLTVTTDPMVTHEYQESGTFSVELIVTDNFGATAATESDLVIDNQPPFVSFTAVLEPGIPLRVVFDATASVDTDGWIRSYEWFFGDGETGSASVDPDSRMIDMDSVTGVGDDPADGITANHRYSSIGSILSVRGLPAEESTSIAIGDVDGDGVADIVVGNLFQANQLFLRATATTPLETIRSVDISSDLDATQDVKIVDLNGDGFADLVTANGVVNADQTLTGQENRVYLWNDLTGTFDDGVVIGPEADVSTSVSTGLVDADTFVDVVFGNTGAPNRVYLGDGVGGFSPAIDISADIADTSDVVLADIDRDGDNDVLVANVGMPNRLYLGDGAGGFAGGLNITDDVQDTTSLALNDLDGDNDLDLVTGNAGGGAGELNRYYLNQCDGACSSGSPDFDVFAGISGVDVTTDSEATTAVALLDADGDGDVDLMASNAQDSTRLYINHSNDPPFDGLFFNDRIIEDPDCDPDVDNCTCRIEAPTPAACTSEPVVSGEFLFEERTSSFVSTDLNDDSAPDLVAVNLGTANKTYLNGCGAPCTSRDSNPYVGAFPTTFPANQTADIAVGDLDADGDIDMVVASDGGANRVIHSAQSTDFALTSYIDPNEARNSRDVELADMDGDGDLDLLIGNAGQTDRYYANTCNGVCLPDSDIIFDPAFAFDVNSDLANTSSLFVGDVDDDGDLDLVAGNGVFGDQPNRVVINQCVEVYGVGACPPDVNVFDPDPLNPDPTLATTPLFFNIGGLLDTRTTQAIALVDIDLDGDLDLVAGNESQADYLYINSCDGSCDPSSGDNPFAMPGVEIDGNAQGNTQAIALSDVDNDGDADLVVGFAGQANHLYLNDQVGPQYFSAPGVSVGSDSDTTFAIAVADVNGDGFADIVAGNEGINRVYLSDPANNYFSMDTPGTSVTTDDDSTRSIMLVDVGDSASDARLDVVVGNLGAPNRIHYNQGVHIITLRVTDNAGATSSIAVSIDAQ